MRKFTVTVGLALVCLPGASAADLRSDGNACYRAGDIVCAVDTLTEHYRTGGDMLGRDGLPTTDAKMLIESLVIMADNTAAGVSLSRIELVLDHVNASADKAAFFGTALHTLRFEQCDATGQTSCAQQSKQIFQANSDNWRMSQLNNRRMEPDFDRRVLAMLRN